MIQIDKMYRRLSPEQQKRIDGLLSELETEPCLAANANENAEERFASWPDRDEELRAELAAARRTAEYWKAEHLAGNVQLAAEQAKNVGLREALKVALWFVPDYPKLPENKRRLKIIHDALSAPPDAFALESRIAKAGEKMREAAIATIKWPYDHQTIRGEIRALPGVTLEDLK
jgi:hypothetical protein